ncbi:Uma2 family endonuclease [Streptacidiphilus sp. MAP5-3]|uniref:Uma2 family endonuclease n=1 Tax=unclassified Streptacidiphilus TaxID=2643834 RepID=UPI003514B709
MSHQDAIYRHLREMRAELFNGLPREVRSEISGGEIVMMMSPVPKHGLAAKDVVRQLDAQLPEPLLAVENTDTDDASLGKLRMPDIMVAPRAAFDTDEDAVDARELVLAVEIVSRSNPDNDYVRKMADYAAMGIEHYLIVDPRDGTCLYATEVGSKGQGPEYLLRTSYPYGDVIRIGDLATIDTTGLPRYGEKGRR